MAKSYETVVIVDAMIPDEAIESEFDAIEQHISSKGQLLKADKWGKRRMAYNIKGRSHGEYAVFYYESEPGFPAEMEKRFRINENILRWLTISDNPYGPPQDKEEESSVQVSKPKEGAKPEAAAAQEPQTDQAKEGGQE